METAAAELPSLGASFGLSLVSLGVVCLVAWVVLRWLGRRGVGQGAGSAIRVVARCPLEGRRALYIVEAGGRCFLIGSGEGALNLITELDGEKVAPAGRGEATRSSGERFAAVLAGLLGPRPARAARVDRPATAEPPPAVAPVSGGAPRAAVADGAKSV